MIPEAMEPTIPSADAVCCALSPYATDAVRLAPNALRSRLDEILADESLSGQIQSEPTDELGTERHRPDELIWREILSFGDRQDSRNDHR